MASRDGIPNVCGRDMTAKSDLYLQKAVEFEAKAREAKDASVKKSYDELARYYRQLAAHVFPSAKLDPKG